MANLRSGLTAVASAAVFTLTTAGCLQSRVGPVPKIDNSTDDLVYAAFWRETGSNPFVTSIPVHGKREILIYAPDGGCLFDGGWHTLEIYDRIDPDHPLSEPIQEDDLIADPVYVQDLERDPICEHQTWTWSGERLVRTD